MGSLVFLILLAVVVLLTAFSLYLLVRIIRVYRRARMLEKMRAYETILYASLQKLSPEQTLNTLIADPDPMALEEVLLRMGDEATEQWREKVIELYRLAGFADTRMRRLGSRLKSRRRDAARRLGRIGEPRAAPVLEGLLRDPAGEVREAARLALEGMGSGGTAGAGSRDSAPVEDG